MTVETKHSEMTQAQVNEAMYTMQRELYDALYEADEMPSYVFNSSEYAQVHNITVIG